MDRMIMYRYEDVAERGGTVRLVLRHYRVGQRTENGCYVIGNCRKFFVRHDDLFAQATKEEAFQAYLQRKRVQLACTQRLIDKIKLALQLTPDEPVLTATRKEWSYEATES